VTALLGILIAIALFGVIVLAAAIRILREYERAVVFRLGRLLGARGPGLVLLIPVIDRMVRVSLRTVTLRIPPQDVITRDNVPATVNAVAYFRVIDPGRAIVEVEDYMAATSQIAQTTLRSVLGKADLDILLSERERLNEDLQRIVDEQTEPWGVKVTTVEIKDVEIPGNMQRAMARQAEAERERRAKIINAEGEYQAAERLYQAATIISRDPAALQLRYLQTLLELGAGQTSTIVFPLPIDIVRPLTDALSRSTGGNGNPPHAPLPPGNGGGSSGGSAPEGGPREIPPGAAGHEGGPIGYRPGASPYSPGPGMDEPPPAEDRSGAED
jgi:regulator of protease activity HflC (stomatin/prohibitin superfamily)